LTLFYKNYNTILPNRTLLKRIIIIICLFSHDTIIGNLVYTIGSSYYKNLIGPEIAYEVTHNISIPQETYLNLRVPVE